MACATPAQIRLDDATIGGPVRLLREAVFTTPVKPAPLAPWARRTAWSALTRAEQARLRRRLNELRG